MRGNPNVSGLLPASFSRAKGRHRAPSKLSTTMNSTARVSAAFAVTGGIVAAVAVPQAASAAPRSASVSVADAGSAASVQTDAVATSADLAKYAAANGTVLDVSRLLSQASQAKPLLENVSARSYSQPAAPAAPAASQPTQSASSTSTGTTRATSRSATRPSASAAVSRSNDSGSGNSGSSNSGSGNSGSSNSSVSLPSGASGNAVIAIAERYLGVPYVYGGSTPSGFDCSGLTSYVYRQLGISLARTAAGQQATVRSVSTPQVGDLVFFGYPAHHVGIYAGNGMMIAAPYPGQRVRLQQIWDTPSGYGRP